MALTQRSGPLRLSLKKNFSWMFFGESVDVLSRWGLLAVLSKLLNPEAVGVFGLALAIVVPTFMFFNMGLRNAQATDVNHQYVFGDYASLRAITTAMGFILIGLLSWLMDPGKEAWQIVMLVALARGIEAQSDVYYGLFQNRERMDYIAQARMLRGPLSLAMFGGGIYFSGDLRVGCLGLIMSALMVLVFHNYRLSKHFIGPIDLARNWHDKRSWLQVRFKKTYTLLYVVFPLGCVGLLTSLQTNIPRYFVENSLGLDMLGYFIAVLAPYSAVTRVLGGIAHSASARLAKRYQNNKRREFLLLLLKLGVLGSAVGGIGIVSVMGFGTQILTLVYTEEYSVFADILVLIMIAAFMRILANLLQFGIMAARQFWAQFGLQVVVLIVSIFGSLVLIGSHGLRGAAFVVIFAAGTHLIGVLMMNAVLTLRLGKSVVRRGGNGVGVGQVL